MRMALLILSTSLVFVPRALPKTRTPNLLTYGIVGSESGAYGKTMSRIPVQKVLLDLAASPRWPEYLDSAVADSGASRADLEKLGLIQRQGTSYIVHFTLFTKSDVARTQIWHYLFGITNRRLVEAGLFADPYAGPGAVKGFIPCVWESTLEHL